MNSRTLVSVTLLVASAALTAWLALGPIEIAGLSDTQVLERFPQSAVAYEDIFGLGFWPSWALLAIAQAALLVGAWWNSGGRLVLAVAALLLGAFLFISAGDYLSFQRQERLFLQRG